MFTTFTLLFAAGVGFRLALSIALRKRFGLYLEVPQALAVLLVVMAALASVGQFKTRFVAYGRLRLTVIKR